MKNFLLIISLLFAFSFSAKGQTVVRATNQIINPQTGTSYAIPSSSSGKLITACNASSQSYTIAQAGTAGFVVGWFADLKNICAGTVTLTPATSAIDGETSITITSGQSIRINSDGSNYFTGYNNVPKEYVDSSVAVVSGSIPKLSGLSSGGGVIWESAYTFRVSAATYYIQGIQYTSAEQTVTLDAAHATLDRIDVLALNTSGTLVKITGTAAAQPSEPDYDPSTQLKLTFVLVGANTSAPAGVSNENIYLENTEWTSSTSGSGWNANSTTNPRTGTKTIEGTSVANAAYVQLQRSSSTALDTFGTLSFFVRSKAAFNNNRVFRVQFFLSGVAKGNALTIADSYWSFDSSNTSSYQLIAIPMNQFAIPSGTLVNQLRIMDVGGALGVYIDDIVLQALGSTISPPAQTGITQAQADARYLAINPLIRESANEIGQRNGTTAQTTCFYRTFTDASNRRRVCITSDSTSFFFNAVGTGTGGDPLLHLAADGNIRISPADNTSVYYEFTSGSLIPRTNGGENLGGASNKWSIGYANEWMAANKFWFDSGTKIDDISDGVSLFSNAAGSAGRLAFAASSSSGASIKRNGTGFDIRNGDDSAYSNVTLANLNVTTAIQDSNGNESLKITATGSAVNEFTVVNAAASSEPELQATGSDSDIDVKVTPKGTGALVINQSTSGAVSLGNAGTYDAGIIRAAAGVIRTTDGASGNGWIQNTSGRCFITSDATNSTATLSNTTCSITVVSGRKYSFQVSFFISDSVAGEGAKFDFDGGSAAATNFRAHCTITDTALLLSSQVTALATDIAQATVTGSSLFQCTGSFEPSGNGTFIPRFAQNSHSSGTLTLFRGSYVWVEDMP